MTGFAVFLTVFLSIYSGMHLYAWIKIRQGMGMGPVTGPALVLFLLIESIFRKRLREQY